MTVRCSDDRAFFVCVDQQTFRTFRRSDVLKFGLIVIWRYTLRCEIFKVNDIIKNRLSNRTKRQRDHPLDHNNVN